MVRLKLHNWASLVGFFLNAVLYLFGKNEHNEVVYMLRVLCVENILIICCFSLRSMGLSTELKISSPKDCLIVHDIIAGVLQQQLVQSKNYLLCCAVSAIKKPFHRLSVNPNGAIEAWLVFQFPMVA